MRRSLLLALAALGAAARPVAAQEADAGRTVVVEVHDDHFSPAVVEVRPGDVVHFVQRGQRRHNVEFRLKGAPEGFDLGEDRRGPYLTRVGEAYELRVDERFHRAGSYPFLCTPHSLVMRGELRVEGEPALVSLP